METLQEQMQDDTSFFQGYQIVENLLIRFMIKLE